MRDAHPGKSDAEAARAFAAKGGYIAIVRYRSSGSGSDFTNIGTCRSEAEIKGYLTSPYCHAAEILYDGRNSALRITRDFILKGHCMLCSKPSDERSLTLHAGNDFYVCPNCGLMFCDGCYVRLPLTASPGYGTCPTCRVQVQRAIPGSYGNQSGATPARPANTAAHVDGPATRRISADYYPLLARAVAGLEVNTAETRRVIYERARTALVTHLRAVTPVLSEREFAAESAVFDEAVRKIERESPQSSPAAQTANAAAPRDERSLVEQSRANPKPEPKSIWRRMLGGRSQPPSPASQTPAQPSMPGRKFSESDNVGTRYDTDESVQNFWTPYILNRPQFPFIFYDMAEKKAAMDAMLSLPPIKLASDSGKLISTEVLQFGVYPKMARGKIVSWGFLLAGDQITPELYKAAIASCEKFNGINPRVGDPPKAATKANPNANQPKPDSAAVAFEREEKVDMLEQMRLRGITISGAEAFPPQIATKKYYRAPDKDAALAFLKQNLVNKQFYYLVVRTPVGVFCRDKDGIYEQTD